MKRLLILLLFIVALSCKKDDKLNICQVVINEEIVEINGYNATISATYSYPSALNINLAYSNDENNISGNVLSPSIDNGVLTFVITDLQPQTKYYYRYEYSNSLMKSKSDVKSFVTQAQGITITTTPVTDITDNSAKTGGTIDGDGQIQIQSRGICYSVHPNPTLNDHVITNGSGFGSFVSIMTDLNDNTEYYVKAYAQTIDSVIFGNQISFKTDPTIILTKPVTDITATTAVCGGNIISDGGSPIIVRGVCWSTHENPTTSDESTTNGNGIGEYVSYLTNLQPHTQYYVRAYAVNSNKIYYGEQELFTTILGDAQTFSVSETAIVIFSPGNLQYNSRSNSWKFADHQYDHCGILNQYIGNDYSGWIDLFGYGTSGYNGCNPWFNSNNNSDYASDVLNIAGTMYDWGMNDINGLQDEWRTLTEEEWLYLLNSRNNASRLRAKAVVNNIRGFLLLPDNWVKPESITFIEDAIDWSSNIYDLSQWDDLENSHAVFLPASGNRNRNTVNDLNRIGGYWSSSSTSFTTAMYMIFTETTYNTTSSARYFGRSVRLVKNY